MSCVIVMFFLEHLSDTLHCFTRHDPPMRRAVELYKIHVIDGCVSKDLVVVKLTFILHSRARFVDSNTWLPNKDHRDRSELVDCWDCWDVKHGENPFVGAFSDAKTWDAVKVTAEFVYTFGILHVWTTHLDIWYSRQIRSPHHRRACLGSVDVNSRNARCHESLVQHGLNAYHVTAYVTCHPPSLVISLPP